jgi:DNA repair exonuclease SbcCD nuclease subunit
MLLVVSFRRPLRVLHTADVHLGSDVYGDASRQAAHDEGSRHLFRGIVDRALADRVDLLLIAGDLFDHNRVPDEMAAFVRTELDRLRQPVVILPGNHDALQPHAVYDRAEFTAGAPHVHVIRTLDGEPIEFSELDLVVWGRAMEEHEPGFQPLGYVPRRDDRRWCLAMGHGFFYPTGQRPERSSPILAEEIRDSGWDYIALGHQHIQTDVSQGRTVAYYAGAPGLDGDGLHRAGTVLRIDFSVADGVRVSRRAVLEGRVE